ncbi:hypothetical protein [Haloferax sulfurifontis]|jgi:hypothetical protein|uniref:Lipoprotein n=1 Tax=Haloferax sulfurifontis TaxID=255616 RepID=A0A830E2M5_9EURY|nr:MULTISPECIES: hypothetical protein [Haloferax]GGC63377.1 hypothetical protein GCM10007209_26890 [Haloferax sulfurifontis]
MKRRTFLTGMSGAIATVAGCAGSDSSSNPTEQNADTETPTETTTVATTTEQPETETQAPTTAADVAYEVKIIYDGEWQGSINAGGTTKSIDGTGTTTYEITGDPYLVSANAQKKGSGNDELTIQILQGGEVISEESTTAEHGLAQVTSQDSADISGDSNEDTETESSFSFKVTYSGDWRGSLMVGGSSRSIDGSGDESFSIDGSPNVISGNAQKQDDSDDKLTVQILENGEVVKESSTTAEYGLAQVSYSSF